MKRINSRAKGCRGERAWRDVLREHGYNARRGAQYSGHSEAPDVLCEDLPLHHFEVKCVESGNPYKWLEQAARDAAGRKYPVVAHKRNGKPWIVIQYADDYLRQIAETDLPRVGKPSPAQDKIRQLSTEYLDVLGIPHDGKGKISIPVKL